MNNKELKIIDAAFHLFQRHGFRKVTMIDIAEASEMSRPSLYAVFANKEAVMNGLVKLHHQQNQLETTKQLEKKKTLKDKLECLFEIWIIEPFGSVIDAKYGKEMMKDAAEYAPEGIAKIYTQFEKHLVEVLEPEVGKKKNLSASDLAHIMSLATQGLKSSSDSVPQLRRLVDGLIAMTLATISKT